MVTINYDNQGNAISRDVPREALALIDAGGNGSERRYNYGDIFRLSGAVARGLLNRGLQRGDRVAILSANRPGVLLTFPRTMQSCRDPHAAHQARLPRDHPSDCC